MAAVVVPGQKPKPLAPRMNRRHPLASRLAAAWPMLPGVPELINGRGLTLAGTTGLPVYQAGQYGPCLSFTAANKHYVNTGLIVTPPRRFAIFARVRKLSTGAQTVIGQMNSGATIATFYLRVNGGCGFTVGGAFWQAVMPDISLGIWHNVGMIYDQTNIYAIIDGEIVTTVAASGLTLDTQATTAKIGRLGDFDGQYWDGQIDAVHLYTEQGIRGVDFQSWQSDPYAVYRPRASMDVSALPANASFTASATAGPTTAAATFTTATPANTSFTGASAAGPATAAATFTTATPANTSFTGASAAGPATAAATFTTAAPAAASFTASAIARPTTAAAVFTTATPANTSFTGVGNAGPTTAAAVFTTAAPANTSFTGSATSGPATAAATFTTAAPAAASFTGSAISGPATAATAAVVEYWPGTYFAPTYWTGSYFPGSGVVAVAGPYWPGTYFAPTYWTPYYFPGVVVLPDLVAVGWSSAPVFVADAPFGSIPWTSAPVLVTAAPFGAIPWTSRLGN